MLPSSPTTPSWFFVQDCLVVYTFFRLFLLPCLSFPHQEKSTILAVWPRGPRAEAPERMSVWGQIVRSTRGGEKEAAGTCERLGYRRVAGPCWPEAKSPETCVPSPAAIPVR